MIVDKEQYLVPDYEINLSSDELQFLYMGFSGDIDPMIASSDCDLTAPNAAKLFQKRREALSDKMKKKVAIVTPETHWFKLTQECTRDTNAAFAGKLQAFPDKLQAFPRTHIELEE